MKSDRLLQGCAQFFQSGVFTDGRNGRCDMPLGWEQLSGKFAVVADMLDLLFSETNDRVVIVSNYTQVPSRTMCLLWRIGFVQEVARHVTF